MNRSSAGPQRPEDVLQEGSMEKQPYSRLMELWKEAYREYLTADLALDQIDDGRNQAALHLGLAWIALARLLQQERGEGGLVDSDFEKVLDTFGARDLSAIPEKHRDGWRRDVLTVFNAGRDYWRQGGGSKVDERLLYRQLRTVRMVLTAHRKRLAREFEMTLPRRLLRHAPLVIAAVIVSLLTAIFVLRRADPFTGSERSAVQPAPAASTGIQAAERELEEVYARMGEVVGRAKTAKPELEGLLAEREQLVANRRRLMYVKISESGPAGKAIIDKEAQLQKRLAEIVDTINSGRGPELAPERDRINAQLQLLRSQKAEFEKTLDAQEDVRRINRETWPRVAELTAQIDALVVSHDPDSAGLFKRAEELRERIRLHRQQPSR